MAANSPDTIEDKISRIFGPLLLLILGLGLGAIVAVLVVYASHFGDNAISPNHGVWGQFGDYLGGTLNPLLGFLSLIALLLTLWLQNRQLRISTKELALTRHQVERSAAAQESAGAAAAEQAKFAALSARIAAIDAAIKVLTQQIDQYQEVLARGVLDKNILNQNQIAQGHRDQLVSELNRIADELLLGRQG